MPILRRARRNLESPERRAPSGSQTSVNTHNTADRRAASHILENDHWNRLRYVKDPDTGKRVSRPNAPSEWVTTAVPELRIVDGELWDQVKQR